MGFTFNQCLVRLELTLFLGGIPSPEVLSTATFWIFEGDIVLVDWRTVCSTWKSL